MSAAGKLSRVFWENKTVLVTGYAGFKGTWLVLWLLQLGARVIGYGKSPQTASTIFSLIKSDSRIKHIDGDIRDLAALLETVKTYQPDIVIHLAAQPLVLSSYQNPVETYSINVMGTVNILDVLRQIPCAKAFINVTTDKCYENKESDTGYQEGDKLGGFDPYSNSKACSELVTDAYCNSFFAGKKIGIATARSGNVIGGGDWALNRLIPDIIRGCMAHQEIIIRHPDAIRPWQHVLDALQGYLLLAQQVYSFPEKYSGAWNFGPLDEDAKPVRYITNFIVNFWQNAAGWRAVDASDGHETRHLKLNSSKSRTQLGWLPAWNLQEALSATVRWYKGYAQGDNMLELTHAQITNYMQSIAVSA